MWAIRSTPTILRVKRLVGHLGGPRRTCVNLSGGGGAGGAPAAVPQTMGLGVVPRESHADQPRGSSVLRPLEQDECRRTHRNAPPSRPSRSQCRCTTTLRSDLLSGPGHQPLRTVLDPPEAVSQDQRSRKMWVSRSITRDLGRRQTRSAVCLDYALYRNGPGA